MLSANIPLEKSDDPKIKEFLVKHVRNGGSIAGSGALRLRVPTIYEKHQQDLRAKFSGKEVFVVVDEMTDSRAKMVLNIMFALPVKSSDEKIRPYLVDMIRLERTNAASVGGAILRTLTLMDINFEQMLGLISDGAAYMKKCWREVLKPVCVNSVHVVCMAHSLNLVGETVRTNAPDVDRFVANMKTAFRLSAAKKEMYVQHLKGAGVESPSTPPAPVITRWYSWLEAVIQHSEYFVHYPEMMTAVQEQCGDTAGVDHLVEILSDDSQRDALGMMLRCIARFGRKIIVAIKVAEGQEVATHKAYNQLEQLGGFLRAAADEDWAEHLVEDGFEEDAAMRISTVVASTMGKAAAKVEGFMSSNEPSWTFLRDIRVLDPNQMMSLSQDISRYRSIPGLSNADDITAEWIVYRKAVDDLDGEGVGDVLGFWHAMRSRTPELSAIATRYLSVPINSVDAERSFSAYNNVVSDKRHNLSEASTEMLVKLYYNSAVDHQASVSD